MTIQLSPALARARSVGVKSWLAGLQPRLLINNEWVPARSGQTFDSIDPVSEGLLAVFAAGQGEDVDDAVRAARRAFEDGPWSRMGPLERGRLLRRLASLIDDHVEEFAELDSLDNGMVVGFAKLTVEMAIQEVDYFAGAARVMVGQTVETDPSRLNYTLREPFGVVGAIVPWNAPLETAITKLAPALAAGNTVVLKPAEQTSLSALRLGELVLEAGFPPGVVNIVTGIGETAGAALVRHLDVDKIGFTGSTEVGKRILAASAGNMKRLSLELGGKSPSIVFSDAKLEQAIPATVAGYSALSGQVCCAGTRVFVHQDIKDEFVAELVKQSAQIKLGDPLDADTTMGPLVSKEQLDRVQSYLQCGVDEGAIVRSGGHVPDGPGYFVEPTVFDGVRNSMRIAQEEIFGPVVTVIPFQDEHDSVLQANDSTYGLSASVWTTDLSRAHTVARKLKVGTVWVNTILETDVAMPWGGYKQSGSGREGGPNWYEHYTQEKAVMVRL